jgi:Ras-related protein Rab-6A
MPPTHHKVVVLGDPAVGKTSIISQFIYGAATTQHQPTVGIDFFAKALQSGGQEVRLQVWDTAGQERFRSLIPAYIRNASVVVIVYDIALQESFDSVRDWHQRTLDIGKPEFVVVGNKIDLESARAVSTADGAAYADSIRALFFETSARTPTGIKELFDGIAGIPAAEIGPAGDLQPTVEKVNLDEIASARPASWCSC